MVARISLLLLLVGCTQNVTEAPTALVEAYFFFGQSGLEAWYRLDRSGDALVAVKLIQSSI